MKLALVFPLLLYGGGVAPAPLSCRITPRQIEVGAFYSGADVKIEGAVAAGSKVIVTVTGSERPEVFNRKGRLGPIWLTAGRVRISGVPSLYLRFSTEPIASLLRPETIARYGLDEASLKARMRIEPAEHGNDAIRSEYLALKRDRKTYALAERGVNMGEAAGCTPFAVALRWPAKAPPGTYQVRVYEVKQGAVVNEISMPFGVVRSGFPAWLAVLSENNAPVYGLTAVLVGAFAGFGIDFMTTRIFGKKRAVSH
jgi:uncharacterized protein (TIGR02186 family)